MVSYFLAGYNEEECLELNVKKIYKKATSLNEDFELFIIDDNSKDKTPLIGKKLEKKHKKIRFVRYTKGPSRRENLAKSFALAKGDIIVFMDADLSADLKPLAKLINAVKKTNDIAIGDRYHKKSNTRRAFKRKFFSVGYNLVNRILFGSKLRDHQCGFKAFKKEVALKIVNQMGYDNSYIRGWFWDAEFLIRAQKLGYKIATIPITWKEAERKSSFRFFRELKVIPYMLKLRFRI